LLFALGTATGLARRGWFIPYRFVSALPPEADRAPYPALEAVFESRARAFADFAALMGSHWPHLKAAARAPPPAPRLDQEWFPPFDALAAWTMVHETRPQKLLEVGGGHSTRIFARAAEVSGAGTSITVIDPQPRRALSLLAAAGHITLHACPVQGLTQSDLPVLEKGDILSLDGSHILMPGSDADIALNRLLPPLPPGVLVHFHDIFLPDPYPRDWKWRAYNEQQGMGPLLWGRTFEILFASHFVVSRRPELAAHAGLAALPVSRAPASSLWLRRAD
jgi:hypothetical protein